MILLASNTLMSAPEIARMLLTDDSQVHKVIHEFNRHGFESLRPRFRGGRPRRISIDDEARIVAVAGARPDTLGMPYTRWSLAKLSRYLRAQRIEVSPPQLGRILARNGISLQRTRSWKQSPDPDYAAKATRILALYREKPKNGVVISFDEKGPESLCPKHGRFGRSSATATSRRSSSRSNTTSTVAAHLTPRSRRPLSSSPPNNHTGTAAAKIHDDRDILHDPATKDYIARRVAEGKTQREAVRLLKRYLARHLYRVLNNQTPATPMT